MGKFDLFNKFNSAVIVLNNNSEPVFRNYVFKRIFSDFENIKKFSHKLNYDVCALVSNNVIVHSPIAQAIASKEDFSAHVSYQGSNNEYFYYDLNAVKKGNYTIIVFTDVTAKVNLEGAVLRNQNFQKKISLLENENKNMAKIKLQAQSQAMKLLLLNNISNIIRESIDKSVILNSALKEFQRVRNRKADRFPHCKNRRDPRVQQGADCIRRPGEGDDVDDLSCSAMLLKEALKGFRAQGKTAHLAGIGGQCDHPDFPVPELKEMIQRQLDSHDLIGNNLIDAVQMKSCCVDAHKRSCPIPAPDFFQSTGVDNGNRTRNGAFVQTGQTERRNQNCSEFPMCQLTLERIQNHAVITGKCDSARDDGNVPPFRAVIAELPGKIQNLRTHLRADPRRAAEHPRDGCR